MTAFTFEDQEYQALTGETVLDCLLREGVSVTNSCRNGICHSCMLKSKSKLNAKSQKGLSTAKKEAGYFLSCQQEVDSPLEVFRPDTSTLLTEGKIISQERISDSVVIIKIETLKEFPFKAGQFLNLIRDDGLCRSYSIASQTGSQQLEFHIRKVPHGEMSSWLYDRDLLGQKIKLSEPLGECSLTDNMRDRDLLLIGVGTGLAPLYGVVRDSLAMASMGKIHLLHGGLTIEGLYLVEDLKNLEKQNATFHYYPVFLRGQEVEGFQKGNIVELVRAFEFNKANTIVMVCGDPQLVKSLKQEVFLAGVPSKHIFSDPFISHTANAK